MTNKNMGVLQAGEMLFTFNFFFFSYRMIFSFQIDSTFTKM